MTPDTLVAPSSNGHVAKADFDMRELGDSGLKRSWGLVTEEFLPQLQGDRANKVYREMGDNDPIVGAVLYALENFVRQVTYTPVGKEAQFVQDCMMGMSHSWEDFIAEALSKLQYGWAYHEVVYTERGGKIVWRKLPIRAQDSLSGWEFDANGGVQGMWQTTPDYRRVFIPISKALHFRTSARRNNPQGHSVLRTAYKPWWYKKRLEEIEAIGIERDVAGIPVWGVPPELLASTAPAAAQAALAEFKNIGQNLRNDEQACVIKPNAYDSNNNPLYTFELLSSSGKKQFVTGEVIDRYSQQIAMASMADVILIGHEKVGSFALSESKGKLLTVGLQAQVDEIASVLNRHGLPRLFELNGMDMGDTRIVPGQIAQVDISALAEVIYKLFLSGMSFFPSQSLEGHLRAVADLPAADGTEKNLSLQVAGTQAQESPAESMAKLAAVFKGEPVAPVVNVAPAEVAAPVTVNLPSTPARKRRLKVVSRDAYGRIDEAEETDEPAV